MSTVVPLHSAPDLPPSDDPLDGLTAVSLGMVPPDGALLAAEDPYHLLANGFTPWRKLGGELVVSVDRPAGIRAAQAHYGRDDLVFTRCAPDDLRHVLHFAFGPELAQNARERCPEADSCRSLQGGLSRGKGLLAVAGFAVLFYALPYAVISAMLIVLALLSLATTLMRGTALIAGWAGDANLPEDVPMIAGYKDVPVISVLIPLLREERMASQILEAVSALDYPKDRLDIKLVLENDDDITHAALAGEPLPDWVEIISVPEDTLRTKPRAMNYALHFCRGEIVGIYDAEDRPEPSQLRRVAAYLAHADEEVACVQGFLDFYNTKQNWLSRCFTIEYAIWFRVLLHGCQRLGLPIPLGGTTVFFRRTVLEEIGAWDAHNVTEDADLGMRLVRRGYRCDVLPTTTFEEANCRALPWVKQRSRWLKGYAMTWATHMRDPARLWHDLGPKGFCAFQILFMGAIAAYLATPLFWVLWTGFFGLGLVPWDHLPGPVLAFFYGALLAGQITMVSVALRAVWAKERRHLVKWVFSLPFYWPLGALAGYKALFELFTKPFYWDKTEHGRSLGTGFDEP
ncbi:glycosyltransferase family 2 protein [Paracoccaceae bacterium GXU_MW_L88]